MRADFRLGDWIIRPRRDCIERGDEIVHIHPRPMAVLERLASAGGEVVSRDELFDTVWPGVIVTDDALTQCIVELRKAFGDSAHHPQIIKTIPKTGFCLIPPVVFLIQEQMAQDDNLDQGVTGSMRSGSLTILISVVTIMLVLALALALHLYLDRPREVVIVSPIPSIAVLPFTDLSEGGDQAYFADGLTEELLNSLARVEGLTVTGRTSSFYFRESKEKLQDIAATLRVNFLLEGSVRKDGKQLRISAKLIDASSGFHLWSQTYDRKLENIFAVQDEISAAITNALKVPLGIQLDLTPRTIATPSTEAYDAYLRGRYLVHQRRLSAIESAEREFEKAIALDPDYALAHAELAIAILLQQRRNYGELTTRETHDRAALHAERAMALDPTLAEAHVASAIVMRARGNHDAARTHLRLAIELNPNYSLAYTSLAVNLQTDLGRYNEAFALHETALRLDPLSRPANSNWFGVLILRNQFSEAKRHIENYSSVDVSRSTQMQGVLRSMGGQWANYLLDQLEASRIDSEPWVPGGKSRRQFAKLGLDKEALTISGRSRRTGTVLRMLGRPEDAVIAAEAFLAEDPLLEYSRCRLGEALAAAGDFERARPILEEIWQQSDGLVIDTGLFSYEMAAALIAIRRKNEENSVGELVAALRDNVHRQREAGIIVPNLRFSVDFEAGLVDYLSGERESGLKLIAKAAEDGYFILPNEAYLQSLYDDPGFTPIMAGQQARQARERKKFLDIVCTDSPYAEIWQPAEGTCKKHDGGWQ